MIDLRPTRFFCALAIVSFCLQAAAATPPADRPSVTFVHLTDAHIFDDGYKKPTTEALEQIADDRRALDWAIRRINSMVASGVPIDFVVYTGDFGLQNVDFPTNAECKVQMQVWTQARQ